MGKKGKAAAVRRRRSDEEVEKPKLDGCVGPAGCVVGVPVDPSNPGDAVRMTCSNGGKCTENKFVHVQCFELLEAKMLRALEAHAAQSRRGSTWTDQQKISNLWNKKGYEVLYKVCPCPCSGYLHKDADYHPTVSGANGGDGGKQDKKKKKVLTGAKPLPTLQQPMGFKQLTQTLSYHGGSAPVNVSNAAPNLDDGFIPGLHPQPKPKLESATTSKGRPTADKGRASADKEMLASGDSLGGAGRRDPPKSNRFDPDSETATVQELLGLINDLMPVGCYPISEVEERVNDVLRYATVDILSVMEEHGGFWEWICSEDKPNVPFSIVVVDGFITKTPLAQPRESIYPKSGAPTCGSPLDGSDKGEPGPCSPPNGEERLTAITSDPHQRMSPISGEDLERACLAHATLSSNGQSISIYGGILDQIRLVARRLGAREFW